MTKQGIRWASDNKIPYEVCIYDIHVFTIDHLASNSEINIEGSICDCQKTSWHFSKCEHCGETRGRSIERNKEIKN